MAVKAGYKQTEVGVIPEDWDVLPLGKLLRRTPTYGINAPATNFDLRLPTYLRITDITEDGRFDETTKASVDHPLSSSYLLEDGDLAFARTGASVGKSYLYNSQDGELVFAGFLIRISPDKKSLLPNFLKFFVQSEKYWSWIKTNSMRSGQPGINGQEYASLLVPVPTLAEQEAIAAALSDADALIAALEGLIAKKRQIKQGAMQELFSVKSGEWRVKSLGDVCTAINDGTHYTPKYVDDGIPFYSVENVTANDFANIKYISEEEHNLLIKRCKPEKGDILMTRIGSLGVTKLIDWDVNASIYVSLALLKVNEEEINSKYLYHYTKSKKFIKDLEARSLVNATPQKINMDQIGKVPISVPPLPEQSAIAEILSDMDSEIAALEGKLSKARHVKVGMMQALLTGRVRLVHS